MPAVNGETTSTEPIFEDSGHDGAPAPPRSIWVSEHAPSPFAAAGLSVSPSGSVTVALRNGGVASVSGSSLCGTLTSTSNPVGLSAAIVSGCAVSDGSNCNSLQPVTGGDTEVADAHAGSLKLGVPSAL